MKIIFDEYFVQFIDENFSQACNPQNDYNCKTE